MDILRQIACMIVNPVSVDNVDSFRSCMTVGRSRLNDRSLPNLCQMVVACLSVSVVGLIKVLFVVCLCSGFRLPLSPLFCFITVFFNYMCFTMMCHRWMKLTEHILESWSCIRIKDEVCVSKANK